MCCNLLRDPTVRPQLYVFCQDIKLTIVDEKIFAKKNLFVREILRREKICKTKEKREMPRATACTSMSHTRSHKRMNSIVDYARAKMMMISTD